MAAVTPFLLKTADNPQGVDAGAFEGMKAGIAADRPAFLSAFLRDFFNVDVLRGKLVSDQAVQLNWNIAAGASPQGHAGCGTPLYPPDYRAHPLHLDLPAVVVHH